MIKLISVDELRPGMFIHRLDVWWLKEKGASGQTLIGDLRQISRIQAQGIRHLWIDLDKTVPPPASLPPQRKSQPESPFISELSCARRILQEGKPKVRSMFNEARMGHRLNLSWALPLVDKIAGSVHRYPSALLSVARLKNHDDYIWLHSMAVCGLMISLAQQLKLDDEQVRRVGLGGLLHDVGKAAIPLDILNKPGKLSDKEFELMKEHPVTGAQMLLEAGAAEDLIDIALHHHEKIDGSGYPHGLKGGEITLYSRMAAVCDVYDAITSIRPYKEGWNPAEAMHRMANWHGHFDRAVFHAFVKQLGIYPVGSLVRLASGSVALVVQPGKASLLRPDVHVFWSLRAQREIKPERAVTATILLSARKRRACGDISILIRSGCWRARKLPAAEIYQDLNNFTELRL